MEIKKERELLPDILRGFAIVLMVFGHCIQDGSGTAYRKDMLYFSDRLYQFIYSFHMPLFMIVSGYLSWSSIERAEKNAQKKKLITKRAAALLVPVFLWTAADYVRILIINHINGEPQPQALIFVYFYMALNNLWFLWAVWWCFLVVYIVHFFMKDNIIFYLILFGVFFFTPDGLCLGMYKYMMPYFIVAYYMHGYIQNNGDKFKQKPKLWMVAAAGLVFAGLFMLYDENSFIYLTGYKLSGKNVMGQLLTDCYRMIIGFAGSVFFIMIWQYIIINIKNSERKFKILTLLGANSMGIYILSGYILVFMVQRLDFTGKPIYLINILETVAVLIISQFLVIIMERIPIIRKFVGK